MTSIFTDNNRASPPLKNELASDLRSDAFSRKRAETSQSVRVETLKAPAMNKDILTLRHNIKKLASICLAKFSSVS
jgi:hypothetical protein